jgi:hypothetical protein
MHRKNGAKQSATGIWLYLDWPFTTKAGWIAIWSYDMIMVYLGLTQKIEQSQFSEQ